MLYQDSHPSDEQLVQHLDGEGSSRQTKLIQAHLNQCWKCRCRLQELENAIGEFVRFYSQEGDAKSPTLAGPRAILKARLSEASAASPSSRFGGLAFENGSKWGLAITLIIFLLLGFLTAYSIKLHSSSVRARADVLSIPDMHLTPGATLLISRQTVCSVANANNKIVPVTLQRQVFQEYGIAAEPRRYEVDYLITPALGGADDIHNLWPQPLSATVWNAKVKDSLEERLREMVCDGTITLAQAQQEIATNWIAAYQKYFHTDKPLVKATERSAP